MQQQQQHQQLQQKENKPLCKSIEQQQQDIHTEKNSRTEWATSKKFLFRKVLSKQ